MGKNGRPETRESKKRRGLLAMIHIAKKELNLTEAQYDALHHGFKCETFAELPIPRLEKVVKFLKSIGWTPVCIPKERPEEYRITALQERVRESAGRIENGDRRLGGMLHKRFGVDRLEWLRDAGELRQLVAVMGHLE